MASFITHDYEFVCTEGATYSVTTWKKYYRYFFIAITITKIATRIAVILTSTNLTRQPCWLYNFIAFENDKDFYTNRFNSSRCYKGKPRTFPIPQWTQVDSKWLHSWSALRAKVSYPQELSLKPSTAPILPLQVRATYSPHSFGFQNESRSVWRTTPVANGTQAADETPDYIRLGVATPFAPVVIRSRRLVAAFVRVKMTYRYTTSQSDAPFNDYYPAAASVRRRKTNTRAYTVVTFRPVQGSLLVSQLVTTTETAARPNDHSLSVPFQVVRQQQIDQLGRQ